MGRCNKEAFKEYHKENPKIYEKFCEFALIAASRRPYYSARSIFHRIRWQTQIEERNSSFKLTDGWSPHYSRKFMEDYPEHEGFFRTKVLKGGHFDDGEDS